MEPSDEEQANNTCPSGSSNPAGIVEEDPIAVIRHLAAQ
jgi:hypothetical protein